MSTLAPEAQTMSGAPPDPATDPFGALEREIRFIARRATSNEARLAQTIHPELEASAYPLLAHIAGHPGTRGSDLAAHFGVGRATVSRQLARMRRLGLVECEVDPHDTRGQFISLTPDGTARLGAARSRRIAALERILADWAREDVSALAALLRRFLDDTMRTQSRPTD
jgi:DNA-binding MarR family transcriptional regulator